MNPGSLSRKKRPSQIARSTANSSARSAADKYNNRSNINFQALSWEDENAKFLTCEVEQTLEDRFWGLENETARMLREQRHMLAEDKRSRTVEINANFIFQKIKWERDFDQVKLTEAFNRAILEEQERENYMKHFYSSASSIQIIDYKWQSRPTVDYYIADSVEMSNNFADGEEKDSPVIGQHRTIPFHAGGTIPRKGLKVKSQSRKDGGERKSPPRREAGAAQGDFQLPNSNTNSTIAVHLDGIQQSRALTLVSNAPVDASSMPKRGPILHSRSSYHIAELALQPETISSGSGAGASGTLGSKKNSSSNKNNRSILIEKVLAELEVPREPGHIDCIDGHAQYKWDQELCLRIAFAKLCTSSSGRLSLKDLKRISHLKEIHDLLKFTVFGSKIKRKKWDFFISLFGSGAHFKDDLSLIDWMQAAKTLSIECRVHERHIRTYDEHTEETFARDPLANPLRSIGGTRKFDANSNNFAYYFANKARSELGSIERSHKLYRSLSVGDCVWGLHDGGVTWLPAIITAIDRKNGDISKLGVATYDLQYPLTARHLNQAKVNASSRIFVTLPSQVDDLKSKFSRIESEKKLCESIFEVIDMEGAGLLPLSSILKFLDDEGIREIVLASGVLSVIVGLRSLSNKQSSTLPTLVRNAIVALFSNSNNDNKNSGAKGGSNPNANPNKGAVSIDKVMISKDDFVAIVNVVLEITQYKFIFKK